MSFRVYLCTVALQRKVLEFQAKAASLPHLSLCANLKSGAKCLGANSETEKTFRKIKIVSAFEEEFLCSATHFLNAVLGIQPYPPSG